MGTVKIELDLPEFEKELSINIIIRKDGEVIYKSSSSDTDISTKTQSGRKKASVKETPDVVKKETKKSSSARGGNLMDIDF